VALCYADNRYKTKQPKVSVKQDSEENDLVRAIQCFSSLMMMILVLVINKSTPTMMGGNKNTFAPPSLVGSQVHLFLSLVS
jgi:hypothetical protein